MAGARGESSGVAGGLGGGARLAVSVVLVVVEARQGRGVRALARRGCGAGARVQSWASGSGTAGAWGGGSGAAWAQGGGA